jgi:hypothetical protein
MFAVTVWGDDRPRRPPEAESASFRMTDRGLQSAFPRSPSKLLGELADAEIPVVVEKSDSAAPRALPPLDADLDSIDTPQARCEFGAPCQACQECGSLDRRRSKGACSSCDSCVVGDRPLVDWLRRPGGEGWFQNTLVFLAADGWKNILDDDHNNNFGFRTGFNMGVRMPGDSALGGQIGISYGAYDFHGREQPLQSLFPDLRLSRDDPIEQQVFGTAGVFKRSDVTCGDPLAWGAVYDVMMSRCAGDAADRLKLAQLRGYLGYALNERNEIGTWAAVRIMSDRPVRQTIRPGLTETVEVNVTDQANLFWHRTWASGGDTMAYGGWADDPGSVVLGLTGRVPLNGHLALFGNAHYIVPSTTGGDNHPTIGTDDIFTQEAWNVSFGVMFYGGGKAVSSDVSGPAGLPLLPVADNGTFSFQ